MNQKPGHPFDDDQLKRFLVALGDTHQDWQVEQAKDAIRLYRYYQDNAPATPSTRRASTDKLWADAVDQMIVSMRLKRLAHRTELTYVSWMRKFCR